MIFSNESLPKAIEIIENQYNIKFSYIDSLIADKRITATIAPSTSLEKIIEILESKTKLHFTITGKNFVTISKFTSKDDIKVCGYIYDEEQKPVKDIRIFFKSKRTNTITDENGYFENNTVPYNSVILISAPGFRQKVLNASDFLNDNCLKVSLINTTEEVLDEVLIQEYIAKGITLDKNKINIDLSEVDILPGQVEPDILQSIQLTPGVNNPFETASGLFIRGSTPAQNLVLWNGIKTYQQGHMFGMLSAFNPYVAKEVNFSKSGVSAKYGDRIAGVVDIQSNKEIPKRFSGGAGFNMINADIVAQIPLIDNKVSLQVSGRRSFTDVLETFTYKKFSDRVFQNTKITDELSLQESKNNFYYTDYNTNLIIKPSTKDNIEINTIYSKNDLDFGRDNSILSFTDELITENEGYNIQWEHQYSDKTSQQVSGYYTKYLLNYKFNTRNVDELIEVESKNNRIQDIGAKYHLNFKLSDKHQLSGGYQFSNNTIEYSFSTTTPTYQLILDQDDRLLNTHAVYTEYTYKDPKNFYFALGFRFNHYSELNSSYFEPRIHLEKYLTKNWTIHTTAELRSQALSQIRESVVSDLSLENQVWTLADEDRFPVITSHQVTFGSSFKKKTWNFDVDGYYKQINDITTLTSGFINPINNTFNIGESSVYGVDVFLKKKFNNYKTWVSYSYINTQNTFEDINNSESFPGNWNIEHTIKWSHFYKLKNFQFSLGWMWHTGKAFTNVAGVDESGSIIILDFGEINSNNLPVYHRLDFSAIYDFKFNRNHNTNYRLGLSLVNVYDRKNILNKEIRTTNSLNNRFINSDIFSLGFTPNVSFRVFW